MMGVGTPVAAQVKLTVCPGTACTDSRGGVTTCGGTAGRASTLRPAPPAPLAAGVPASQHGATPRGLPPSSGDAGFRGTVLGDTAQGPQHGTAWARGAQPRDPCPTWLAVSPAQHPARCHSRVPSHATALAQCPQHRLPAARSSAPSSSLRPHTWGRCPQHSATTRCPQPLSSVPMTPGATYCSQPRRSGRGSRAPRRSGSWRGCRSHWLRS